MDKCPIANCDPHDPKSVVTTVLRLTFGLSLVFIGVSHYQGFSAFSAMVTAGLGPLSFFGSIWAFVMPALLIVGGALFVVYKHLHIAAWASALALGSIPAGMLLKPVISNDPSMLPAMMGQAINAFIWIFVLILVTMTCCKKK